MVGGGGRGEKGGGVGKTSWDMLPPTCKWKNFKKWVFVYWQKVSVFCETYQFIVVKAINSNNKINSQSLLEKSWVGGKLNQIG